MNNSNHFYIDWNYGVHIHCNNHSFDGQIGKNFTADYSYQRQWEAGWDRPFLITIHEHVLGERHFLCADEIKAGNSWNYRRRIRSWWDIDIYSWKKNKGYTKLFSESFDDRNKWVRIKITTESASDAIAWTEVIGEYKKISGANVVIQSDYNDHLSFYDFVDGWEEYGIDTFNTYASYDIGRFYESPSNDHTLNRTFDAGAAVTRRFHGWMNPRKVDRWDVHDVANDVLLSSGGK